MSAIKGELSTRWGLDIYASVYTTSNRSIFKIYRPLISSNDYRAIKDIGDKLPSIEIGKIKLKINIKDKCYRLIVDNILYISRILINLIS